MHGDEAGWDRLARLYTPLVYRWARQAGLQANDAADVVQEVFRSVATAIADFDRTRANTNFRGWLWTITRNKVRDHFRWLAKQPTAAGGSTAYRQWQQLAEALPEELPQTPEDDGGVARRAIEMIRVEFEQRTWQAFWQSAVDGRPTDEIAAELGMTTKAVRQAKYRVLHRLRLELEGLLDE
jgi:RNA polymerase sigma-70 factor (ECF subfamily)